MIIKWPERYSLVMLLHAFIHESKIYVLYGDDKQATRSDGNKISPKRKGESGIHSTKFDISSDEKEAPTNPTSNVRN